MSFRVKAPKLTPDLEAVKEEAKNAPWASREKEMLQDMADTRFYMLLKFPFWGRLAMKMDLMFSDKVDTACVRPDMLTIFNPDFWDGMTMGARTFVIAHELCHLAYLHFDRIEDRDPARWNRAGDYMINAMLMDANNSGAPVDNGKKAEYKLDMPVDEDGKRMGLLEDRFRDMSDVEIYEILEREDREQGRDGSGQPMPKNGQGQDQQQGGGGGGGQQQQQGGGQGRVRVGFGEAGGDCDFGSMEELKQKSEDGTGRHVPSPSEIRNELVAAVASAKQRGHCPGAMDRLAAEMAEPQLSWEEIMKNYLDERFRRDPTYQQLSRRTASYNAMIQRKGGGVRGVSVPLPSRKPQMAPGVIAYDSSGSVSNEELAQMLGETYEILSHYNVPVRYICADAAVQVDEMIESTEEIVFKGGGGTSHVPVFDRIFDESHENYEMPKVIICFTDLWTEFPKEEPPCDVIWVNVADGEAQQPPFGMLINRNPKGKEQKRFLRPQTVQALGLGPTAPAPVAPAPTAPAPVAPAPTAPAPTAVAPTAQAAARGRVR